MDQRKWILAAVAIFLFAAAIFMAMSPSSASAGDVDNSQAHDLIADGVRIVDVRTVAEFAMGHIPGSENVPLNDLPSAAAAWDPAEPILLYCATGDRSLTAMEYLSANGYTQVYNLTVGLVAWDGDLVAGSDVAVAPSVAPSESGIPVMYEFYTDW